MASEVDISNLALAHLGDDATIASIDPPEGSPQAEHCARFFPIARRALLSACAWSFATKTATLAPVDYRVEGWDFAFAVPNKMLRPLRLYETGGYSETLKYPFKVEIDDDEELVLLTNIADPVLRYVVDVTNLDRFTALSTEALSWLLASMIAGPLIKGDGGVKAGLTAYQTYREVLGRAAATDGSSEDVINEPLPDWIRNR